MPWGFTNFIILQGVSNLCNMPKLDQLKCDFSALSLAATSLSLPLSLPLSHSLSVYRVQLNFRAQMSSLNGKIQWVQLLQFEWSIKTHKKERKRKREKGRKGERERGKQLSWAIKVAPGAKQLKY